MTERLVEKCNHVGFDDVKAACAILMSVDTKYHKGTICTSAYYWQTKREIGDIDERIWWTCSDLWHREHSIEER